MFPPPFATLHLHDRSCTKPRQPPDAATLSLCCILGIHGCRCDMLWNVLLGRFLTTLLHLCIAVRLSRAAGASSQLTRTISTSHPMVTCTGWQAMSMAMPQVL